MQIMQSTLFRGNTTILSFSQIPTPICHQMQSTNQWNCTTYPQKQESQNWLGKQGIPRFWIALEEEENQRSPFYRLPESKYKHITKWTDESWKRNWDFQLLERVQPACQENIFQKIPTKNQTEKIVGELWTFWMKLQICYPLEKGSLFDEQHIGKGEALCCALEKGITECRKFECEMFCWKLYLLFIISSIIMTYRCSQHICYGTCSNILVKNIDTHSLFQDRVFWLPM